VGRPPFSKDVCSQPTVYRSILIEVSGFVQENLSEIPQKPFVAYNGNLYCGTSERSLFIIRIWVLPEYQGYVEHLQLEFPIHYPRYRVTFSVTLKLKPKHEHLRRHFLIYDPGKPHDWSFEIRAANRPEAIRKVQLKIRTSKNKYIVVNKTFVSAKRISAK